MKYILIINQSKIYTYNQSINQSISQKQIYTAQTRTSSNALSESVRSKSKRFQMFSNGVSADRWFPQVDTQTEMSNYNNNRQQLHYLQIGKRQHFRMGCE